MTAVYDYIVSSPRHVIAFFVLWLSAACLLAAALAKFFQGAGRLEEPGVFEPSSNVRLVDPESVDVVRRLAPYVHDDESEAS